MPQDGHASSRHASAFAEVGYQYGTLALALHLASTNAGPRLVRAESPAAKPSFRMLDTTKVLLRPTIAYHGCNPRGALNGHRLELGAAITMAHETGDFTGTLGLSLTLRESPRVIIHRSIDTSQPAVTGPNWHVHVWDRPEDDTVTADAHALILALWEGGASGEALALVRADPASIIERLNHDHALTCLQTLEEVARVIPALVQLLVTP